jgi:hypothetical protein
MIAKEVVASVAMSELPCPPTKPDSYYNLDPQLPPCTPMTPTSVRRSMSGDSSVRILAGGSDASTRTSVKCEVGAGTDAAGATGNTTAESLQSLKQLESSSFASSGELLGTVGVVGSGGSRGSGGGEAGGGMKSLTGFGFDRPEKRQVDVQGGEDSLTEMAASIWGSQ